MDTSVVYYHNTRSQLQQPAVLLHNVTSYIHLSYVLLLVQEKMYQLIISELIILEPIILELMEDKTIRT